MLIRSFRKIRICRTYNRTHNTTDTVKSLISFIKKLIRLSSANVDQRASGVIKIRHFLFLFSKLNIIVLY